MMPITQATFKASSAGGLHQPPVLISIKSLMPKSKKTIARKRKLLLRPAVISPLTQSVQKKKQRYPKPRNSLKKIKSRKIIHRRIAIFACKKPVLFLFDFPGNQDCSSYTGDKGTQYNCIQSYCNRPAVSS